ncbi:hypothetical protein FVER53590_25967 [Fusarium verticillioides]|nr:hypothetical protein FVER53590_25967 [Fusarium verticillioides]
MGLHLMASVGWLLLVLGIVYVPNYLKEPILLTPAKDIQYHLISFKARAYPHNPNPRLCAIIIHIFDLSNTLALYLTNLCHAASEAGQAHNLEQRYFQTALRPHFCDSVFASPNVEPLLPSDNTGNAWSEHNIVESKFFVYF